MHNRRAVLNITAAFCIKKKIGVPEEIWICAGFLFEIPGSNLKGLQKISKLPGLSGTLNMLNYIHPDDVAQLSEDLKNKLAKLPVSNLSLFYETITIIRINKGIIKPFEIYERFNGQVPLVHEGTTQNLSCNRAPDFFRKHEPPVEGFIIEAYDQKSSADAMHAANHIRPTTEFLAASVNAAKDELEGRLVNLIEKLPTSEGLLCKRIILELSEITLEFETNKDQKKYALAYNNIQEKHINFFFVITLV